MEDEKKGNEPPAVMTGVEVVSLIPVNSLDQLKNAFKLRHDIPVPKIKPNQVLVRIYAAGVNPADWKVATDIVALFYSVPFAAGHDFAGEVISVGTECKRIRVGDFVYGTAESGGFLQYLAIDEVYVAVKPPSMTFAEASAVPMAAMTAYQALFDKADLKKEHKLLILGGSGGIGSFGVQLAKVAGVSRIVVTCSAKNAEFVTKLGADQVIDYKTSDWSEVFKGQAFDVILDIVGGRESWEKAPKVLKSSGTFVTVTGDDAEKKVTVLEALSMLASVLNRKFWSFFPYPNYSMPMQDRKRVDQLSKVGEWLEQGKVKCYVEKVYDFESYLEGIMHVVSHRAVGKVCLALSPKAFERA